MVLKFGCMYLSQNRLFKSVSYIRVVELASRSSILLAGYGLEEPGFTLLGFRIR
jgi:hypothetical protein